MRREALRFVTDLDNMPQALKLLHADKIEKQDKIARKALKLETDKPPVAINIRLLAQGTVARLARAASRLSLRWRAFTSAKKWQS